MEAVGMTTRIPRPYTPTGVITPLMEAVKDEPTRLWNYQQAAEVMGITASRVSATTLKAVEAGLLFRGPRDGVTHLSGQPFKTSKGLKITNIRMRDDWTTTMEDVRVPKVVAGWVPPRMVCVRQEFTKEQQ
jgi:hypothetical protein